MSFDFSNIDQKQMQRALFDAYNKIMYGILGGDDRFVETGQIFEKSDWLQTTFGHYLRFCVYLPMLVDTSKCTVKSVVHYENNEDEQGVRLQYICFKLRHVMATEDM